MKLIKNAAHMITKLFALELPNCCFVNLHPGWVKTGATLFNGQSCLFFQLTIK